MATNAHRQNKEILLNNAKLLNPTEQHLILIEDVLDNTILFDFVGVQSLTSQDTKFHQMLCRAGEDGRMSILVDSYSPNVITHQLTTQTATGISNEFDMLLLNNILQFANKSTTPKDPFKILPSINTAIMQIARNTHRGGGNKILMSSAMHRYLNDSLINGQPIIKLLPPCTIHTSDMLTNEILITYKPDCETSKCDADAGIIFTPYQLLRYTDGNFSTQYSIFTDNAANYYELIEVQ